MSVKWLPREMGMWLSCDGTDDKGCEERTFAATILATNNREWFAKNGGWGRGLRKGYKRRDLCPSCVKVEQKLFEEETAKTEAWKKERAERRKAAWAEKKASKEAEAAAKPKKPRKKKSTAVSAGAVTAAEEASIGRPSSPSAASAPAPAT